MEIDKFKKLFNETQQFQSEKFWNNIFDNQKNSSLSNQVAMATEPFPKCDLFETEEELVVEAEIPGLSKDYLQISIHQQALIITGEFKTLKENRKYYLKERANRKFRKEITLPYPIRTKQVKSEMRQGILTIRLPINNEEIENIPIRFNHPQPEN